jgi:hypothetical protein
VFDGPINAQSFVAYVNHDIVPTLKPRDIVVLDNLGSHKGTVVRAPSRSTDWRATETRAPPSCAAAPPAPPGRSAGREWR